MYEEKVIYDEKTSVDKCREKMNDLNEDESHIFALINNDMIILRQNSIHFDIYQLTQ